MLLNPKGKKKKTFLSGRTVRMWSCFPRQGTTASLQTQLGKPTDLGEQCLSVRGQVQDDLISLFHF